MNGLQGKLGVWANVSQRVLGKLHAIQDMGFDYLVVKCVNHPRKGLTAAYQPDVLRQLIHDAGTIGMPIACWAYVYPNGIEEQTAAISASLPAGITDLILDAETEWEQPADAGDNAEKLTHGIAVATGHRVTLHLSSYCNPNDHPVPMKSFLAHCHSFMPQCYEFGGNHDRVMERLTQQSVPLGQASLGRCLLPTVNSPTMLRLVADAPIQGANVWLWHDDGTDDKGVESSKAEWKAAIAAYKAARKGI